MRKTLFSCVAALVATYFVTQSCTNTESSYFFEGNPISFFKSLQEVQVTFPTSVPGREITFKFKTRSGTVKPDIKEAILFLKSNYSYMETYRRDYYDCKQFAYRLYQDAQEHNFEVRYAILSLVGQKEGHAVTVVETSDGGELFVDFTPYITANDKQKPSRTISQVKEGRPYIRIPLEIIGENFKNSDQDFIEYQNTLTKAEEEVKSYNSQIDTVNTQKSALESRIVSFKEKVQRGVAAENYNAMKSEQDSIEQDANSINAKFDELNSEEERLRSTYYAYDWVGKDWIVKSIKIVP